MPLLPEVIVIQAASSEAFQEQSVRVATTLKLPVPPLEVKIALAGEMLKAHGNGRGGSCFTVWLFPATVIVADLAVVPVLAETE
jgi:hypothetical protein